MTKTQDTPAPPRTNALPTVNARIYPRGGLDILSRDEVARLRDASRGGMHDLLRRCTLAVLTTGSTSDDPRAAQELYPDFDIEVRQQDRSEEHTSELQSLMRISYAVFCLKKKTTRTNN